MKKIFFALAALVLAFTGCSQEEDAIQVSEKKAIKVVVNMDKPGFGEDTRAPRQDWEEGDEVVVMLGNDLQHLISLRYSGTSWEERVMYLDVDIFRPMTGLTATDSYLASLPSNGTLKAIYCSSGIYGAKPFPEEYVDVEDLEGIDIISYARNNEDYDEVLEEFIPNPLGECVMTCEYGEYSVSGGVLTLDITMIPQVAQFTIKDLNVEDDYSVGYAGTMTAYAGGKFTAGGVVLEPLGELLDEHDAWVHDNEDGISIYASPWQEVPDGFDMELLESVGGLGYFCFFLYDTADNEYYRDFQGRSTLKNGDAVIFDGPTTDASKWD